ncbi:hypothetical protein EDC01DRAFT_633414 [Geopyxis carbonaria]|nr:hypothetical protein EDC01DRAFT_633414 [Geopyxis carbonaria]
MNTISTLCATSTVGIAACGYALAVPSCAVNDHPTNPSSNINRATEHFDQPSCRLPHESSRFAKRITPSNFVGTGESLETRPSSRRWLRRLSESFSSSPTSSFLSSTTQSSVTSSASSRSRSHTTSQPNTRPPTRNKLVKRSPSQRLSRSNSPVPPRHRRRPSTAITQLPTRDSTTHLSPIHPSRPSTSGLETLHPPPYNPQPVNVWGPFFPAKRQKINHADSATRLAKSSCIRRIVPDLFRRRHGPTLVIAPLVNTAFTNIEEDGTESLCSEIGSLPTDSRPVSHMGEIHLQPQTRQRSLTSATPASGKANVRRSFSLSNFLGVTPPKDSSTPNLKDVNDESLKNGFVGICSMGVGFNRRYSTSTPGDLTPSHPYQYQTRPNTPAVDEIRRQTLPPIQSLSLLEVNLDEPGSTERAASIDELSDHHSQIEPAPASIIDTSTMIRPHRLSIMSASERASTLVGSDSEHDFGSDTLFDSMRTRISELTPVRVDSIFNFEGSVEFDKSNSPLQVKMGPQTFVTNGHTSATGIEGTESSPESARTAMVDMARMSLEEDDDGWSSDWDIPSKGDVNEHRLSAAAGLRPYSGILSGSHLAHSNTSNTSFGTAPEVLAVETSSLRETNSILDWNDGVSVCTTSPDNAYRPKTVHGKESLFAANRTGRRAPTIHVRSQSVPVVNTLRGRVPLPSENWDDDFLDEDDEGVYQNKMIIPRVIEEQQASIVGHLGCVREFALLVEDLKRLRETAIKENIRHNKDTMLWDEADGIIALASVDDDEEDAPLKKDRLHRQNAWSPANRRPPNEQIDDNSASIKSTRRSSVLLPDDDTFGGCGTNLPATSSISQLKQAHRLSPGSSPSPPSKKFIDRNDPIEVAKSMMEKMQQRHSSEHLVSSGRSITGFSGGKVHFDTDMLKDLVIHVGHLKRDLTKALEDVSHSQDKILRIGTKAIESPNNEKVDFDLSPIRSSLDENLGNRVRPNRIDFRPVVEIA